MGVSPFLETAPHCCLSVETQELSTRHLITIGGWNGPHPDTSFTGEEWFHAWHAWNQGLIHRWATDPKCFTPPEWSGKCWKDVVHPVLKPVFFGGLNMGKGEGMVVDQKNWSFTGKNCTSTGKIGT